MLDLLNISPPASGLRLTGANGKPLPACRIAAEGYKGASPHRISSTLGSDLACFPFARIIIAPINTQEESANQVTQASNKMDSSGTSHELSLPGAMEVSASQNIPANQNPEASRQQNDQRPRRGGGHRGRAHGVPAFRPSSVAPDSGEPNPADSQSRRGNGRGRGRGRGRGQAIDTKTVNGRSFGGQLTHDSAVQLQGGAPAFVPGQHHVHPVPDSTNKPRQRQPKKWLPKSEAPDIATRTHEDIDRGYYECPICTSDVQRNSKVWSCHICWTVFHLSCIKKWSSNLGASTNQQNAEGEQAPRRQWRCPGCNLPKDGLPSAYTCWCEKENDPRPLSGLPPHSCGQTCGKERVRKCPHPCQLTCHAGPCPPCSHMGPIQSCFCGKHETTKRCSETDFASGWSCGEICGTAMPCGEHTCYQPCHEGACGACEVRIPARCYCGQMEKDVLCSDRGESRESMLTHGRDDVASTELLQPSKEPGETVMEHWTGVFDCGRMCDRKLDCGVHQCENGCHPQEAASGHCLRSPDVVTHCSCGKTPLHDLTDEPRMSCMDPIPACSKPCEKPLKCGHPCPKICHSGDCPSCAKRVTINCRCGRTTSNTLCHQGTEEAPQCRRICRANLNCGRHACEERCCPGERKAMERQSNKRRQRPLSSAPRGTEDGFEAEHICTRQCGRPLKCGNHVCEELCHKGPCASCREAIFEEVSCHCGRTVLQPPLPCGTQPPLCRQPCGRPKTCGHPQVPHNCHQDDEDCPRCPFLVQRMCLCGKKAVKNQQCWFQDVRCGEVCGKQLKCGSHYCRMTCHRAGECEDAGGQPCQQPCGKEKKICGHPDEAICHAPYPCKEEKPCNSKLFVFCDCQAQKLEMKCGACKSSEGNLGKSLQCNEECARLERNRRLAVALNIDQSTHIDGGDHVPYSADTLNLFAQSPKWAQTQEREFRVFAAAADEKQLRFKPMQPQQRAFLHSLAGDFGLDAESVDPGAHRHVLLWKSPKFVSAPNKTLADALRIRQQAQRSANASANVSDNEGSGMAKARKKAMEPYNGFVISRPRFGLTIDEVRTEVNALMHQHNPFTFDIEFLPNEEVVLKAISRSLPPSDLEALLQNLRAPLSTAIAKKGYGSTQLCTTDSSLNILRLESDNMGGDGWSRVAAKKAAPKSNLQSGGIGATNAFAALSGGKITFAKKKVEKVKVKSKPEAVVDDWEVAETAEEEREMVGSASEDDGGAKVEMPLESVDAECARIQTPPKVAEDATGKAQTLPEATGDVVLVGGEVAVPAVGTGDQSVRQDWAEEVEDAAASQKS